MSTALSSLALSHVLYNPISLCGPLFMQNALGASPLTVGLVLAVLPLSTAISSPWSGRLADRFEARRIATLGLGLLFVGIFFYSRLGVSSNYFLVCVALALMGLGTGFFIPANQKAAFSSVRSGDYGILSAMLSSFGTAAGTLGITVTVALMASMMSARGFQNPGEFAGAQQFAFTSLLPLGAIAIWVSWSGKSKESE